MNLKKIGIIAASALAVGAFAIGGTAIANADDTTPASSAGAVATPTDGAQDKGMRAPGGAGGTQDTPVTGDEAAKVSEAVAAKDSTVTVHSVRKDPDGSYDVLGTKVGAPVMFDVSADLATITEHAGGPGAGGRGGSGGPHGGQPPTQDGTQARAVPSTTN